MSTVGELCSYDFHDEIKLEWKVKDFFLHTNGYFTSPEFSFAGISWHITMYPCGLCGNEKSFSIFIVSETITAPVTMAVSLHLKTVDGKPDTDAKYTNTNVFPGYNRNGCREFISRSKLIERKAELLPAGFLTVICILKKGGTNLKAAGSETNVEITKTKEGTAGNATNDEFTKMKEETDLLKLQQHFEEIFQNGNFSDVVLKVDDQEFKCHKCVLARSPVFSAMMSHEMKEKNTGVVDIQDDNPNTFYDFLHYLYTGNKEIIKSESVVNLFTVADKYQVEELKKSCLDYMLKNISVDNFCDVLSLSLVHVEKDLTDACCQFYIKNSLSIVITPKWLEFMIKYPVAANELNIKQLKSNMEIKN